MPQKIAILKSDLRKVIRQHCVKYCGGSFDEVQKYSGGYSDRKEKLGYYCCTLFPHRFGKADSSINSE